jgi:hypothetical protein
MWKSAGRAPSLRVFTLVFALQLRKKHGKPSVRVRETSVRLMKTSVRVRYDIIYLFTAIGLSPGGSTHLHTNNRQNNTNNNRTTQITNNVEECGPCPVFAGFTLAFVLQLRKKHGKTSVRVILH